MSFSIKTVRVTVHMAEAVFGNGNNAVTIEGLPTKVSIDKPGGEDENKMTCSISGLKLEEMEQLTVLGFKPNKTFKNVITIEAGTKGETLSTVFQGEVSKAVPIFSDDGIATLEIEATTGNYPNKIVSPQTSVQGDASVEELMQQFASAAGYAFQNEGVTAKVKNSLFKGSPIVKAKALARQARIELLIDDQKFVIMPLGGNRSGTIPKFSKESGLLGYPSFTDEGIDARVLFDTRLNIGGLVEIESIVPKASGIWKITKLTHELQAYQSTNSSWESSFSTTWVQEAKS